MHTCEVFPRHEEDLTINLNVRDKEEGAAGIPTADLQVRGAVRAFVGPLPQLTHFYYMFMSVMLCLQVCI